MKRLFSNKTSCWHMIRGRSSKFSSSMTMTQRSMKHSRIERPRTEFSWSRKEGQLSWSHRWNEFIAYDYIYVILWNFMGNEYNCAYGLYEFGYINVGDVLWKRNDILTTSASLWPISGDRLNILSNNQHYL